MGISPSGLTCLASVPQATHRLLCFPHAGGNASAFRRLASMLTRSLQGRVSVWAIEYPGHGTRSHEQPLHDCQRLVNTLVEELAAFVQAGPYCVLGVSLGALLSCEVVRALQQQNAPLPDHLYVAACGAPHLQTPLRYGSDTEIRAYLRTVGGDAVSEAFLDHTWAAITADFSVRTSYLSSDSAVALLCPITAFGGKQDAEVSETALLAWQEQTRSQSFKHVLLEGGHFFWQHNRTVFFPLLANALAETLRQPVGGEQR